jgi:hypothetical protein
MPCPCFKREPDEEYCLNGDVINEIYFVDFGFIPSCPCSDKVSNSSLCLNLVYADNDGFLRCGTSKRRIIVRNHQIPVEDYSDARKRVLEFYHGDLIKVNSCPECLYKTIVGIILKRLSEKTDSYLRRESY